MLPVPDPEVLKNGTQSKDIGPLLFEKGVQQSRGEPFVPIKGEGEERI